MPASGSIDKRQLRLLLSNGYTDREAAAVFGVTPQAVLYHRRRFRLAANRRLRRWTADEVTACRQILAAGGSLRRAAGEVRHTPCAVQNALRRHNTEGQPCSC